MGNEITQEMSEPPCAGGRPAARRSEVGGEMTQEQLQQLRRRRAAQQGRKLFSEFHSLQASHAAAFAKKRNVESLLRVESPRISAMVTLEAAEAAGVTAVVFRARFLENDSKVAVKVMRIRVRGVPEEQRRRECEEEARLQRLCAHGNTVRLIDFDMGPNFAIFVLEYIPETLLQNIVERNTRERYSERTAASYVRDVASALKRCHHEGVVHFDVKLDNLLCTEDNNVKLCDFGIAQQLSEPNSLIKRTVAAPLFAPPEIHTTGWCTTSADMWSLGVVLYILLCGYPPFKESELRYRITRARYTFPERDWAQVSIMARDLISRLLVVDTAERYTAQQVLDHPWIQALSTLPKNHLSLSPEYYTPKHNSMDARIPVPRIDVPLTLEETAEEEDDDNGGEEETNGSTDENDKEEEEEGELVDGVSALNQVTSAPPALVEKTSNKPGQQAMGNTLPLRVTKFLRNMHIYRELEKKGFDSVPGGELYRDLLEGVDHLASGLMQGQKLDRTKPSWLLKRMNKVLFAKHSSLSSSDMNENGNETDADGDTFKDFEDASNSEEGEDIFSTPLLAPPDLDQVQLEKTEIDANIEPLEESHLTTKDVYAFAKFKRKDSFHVKEMGTPRLDPVAPPSSFLTTAPPKGFHKRSRLLREKSFDVQPQRVLDWIADSEAVSCRICDKEFSLFVRKHHCRYCFNVMCDACSFQRRRLDILETEEPVRVCNLCALHLPRDRNRA